MGFKFSFWKNSVGQSLIELLVAIGLSMVILPGLLTGFIASREGKAQEGQRLQGYALMKEMEEAVKSVRENGWSNLGSDGTFHPTTNGANWSLTTGAENIAGTDFYRQFDISSVQRDSSGNIGAGTNDPSTKKIDYTVSWSLPNAGSITSSEYLQRYLGNTNLSQTTQADFNLGTKVNTTSTNNGGGTIQLTPKSPLTQTFTDDYTNSADYNFDSNKIEVTGGFAQLKGTSSGTNTTLNPTADSNVDYWAFILYGNDSGQTGKWNNSGGNPKGNISVDFLKRRNSVSGGYWYQAFTITTASSTGTLTFDWSVPTYAATPDSLHLYAWIDTGLGTPATIVWDSGNITSTGGFTSVSLNIASFIVTPGTYYLKVGAYLDYPSTNTGGFKIVYDNILLTWSGGIASYPSDSPTIYPKTSFSAAAITSWNSFTATEVPDGGSIRYQLSGDNGTTWQYWNGSAWATVSAPTNYNDASTINNRIGTYPVIGGQILVKAFLISNGSQFVRLDKIVIGYTGSPTGSNSGTFVSSTMDSGGSVAFNRLAWTDTNTVNTTTKLQVAINSDNSTWNFFGPDGTGGTYFTNNAGTIPLANILGRYARYKIFFDSTSVDIPVVSDVNINYSP